MPSNVNVEIKATLTDRERAIRVARELSGQEGEWEPMVEATVIDLFY